MVGDGALDMQAGKDLNMYCIGVLSGSNDAQALLKRWRKMKFLQDYREI